MQPLPIVGEVVQYIDPTGLPLAAIVTAVNPDKPQHVNLCVFRRDGGAVAAHQNVRYGGDLASPKPGTWREVQA